MTRMLALLQTTDRAASRWTPLLLWAGQAAVVVLGTHLATDVLDDVLLGLLDRLPLGLAASGTSVPIAAWTAVLLELAVAAWCLFALARGAFRAPLPMGDLGRRLSLGALATLGFWLPTALAGSWVIAMAVEDATAHALPGAAWALGVGVGLLSAWRLGWSGMLVVLRGLPEPKSPRAGALLVPVLLPLALVAWSTLPIWGWR